MNILKIRFFKHSTSKKHQLQLIATQNMQMFPIISVGISALLLPVIVWVGAIDVAGFWPGALVQPETAYCGGHATECKMRNS